MTPSQMQASAIRIYGRKAWKKQLARALGVNVCTIHRMMHRPQVPPVYGVAIEGLIANHYRVTTKGSRE